MLEHQLYKKGAGQGCLKLIYSVISNALKLTVDAVPLKNLTVLLKSVRCTYLLYYTYYLPYRYHTILSFDLPVVCDFASIFLNKTFQNGRTVF